MPASTSADPEATALVTVVTATVPNPSPAGQLQQISTMGNYTSTPNAIHPSSAEVAPASAPTITRRSSRRRRHRRHDIADRHWNRLPAKHCGAAGRHRAANGLSGFDASFGAERAAADYGWINRNDSQDRRDDDGRHQLDVRVTSQNRSEHKWLLLLLSSQVKP